ncbi:glycosyltransferase family 2 protein [Williamsia sp. M5A3_1d]
MTVDVEVTVCVPLYRHERTVERCLRSVLAQDHPSFEILVIDDASGDDGARIARELIREGDRVVVNDPRLGAAGNHNRCIELARGALIQFVHGDDELLPGALTTLSACFADPEVAMAFAPREVVTDDEDFRGRAGSPHLHFGPLAPINDATTLINRFLRAGAMNNWFGEPTSVMFARDRALQVGGFRDDLVQIFDFDLWLRVSSGRRIAYCDAPQSVRHHDENTLSALNVREKREWLDHTRFLWATVVDTRMPAGARLYGAIWLIWCYPTSLGDAVRGPRGIRLTRLRQVCAVPFAELRRRWAS